MNSETKWILYKQEYTNEHMYLLTYVEVLPPYRGMPCATLNLHNKRGYYAPTVLEAEKIAEKHLCVVHSMT
jgi:hypothetical protein